MNTNTTTANVAKAHNFRGTLPHSFPMPEEMEGLRIALPGMHELAQKILAAGPEGLETRTRSQLWEYYEEKVMAEFGQTWREYVANVPGTNGKEETKQDALIDGIYTMEGEELARYRKMESRGGERVELWRYRELVSAACASRRAGITPTVWANRFELSKEDREMYAWVIARIAIIAWTMPVIELFHGKPCF